MRFLRGSILFDHFVDPFKESFVNHPGPGGPDLVRNAFVAKLPNSDIGFVG